MYEMIAGRELADVFPTDGEYELIEEQRSCKEIIQYIFTRKQDGRLKHCLDKVSRVFYELEEADSEIWCLCRSGPTDSSLK